MSTVFASLAEKIMKAADVKPMLQEVSVSLLPVIKSRIHENGTAADGSKIGTYSNAYLKLRIGNYANADKKTKGKSKGELKNSGTHTKGLSAGKARPKYNRTGDADVVLSLTRQMENDFSVQPTDKGYGLGFNNDENYNKAIWNEKRYAKLIYGLTENEKQKVIDVADKYLTNAIH